MKILINGISAKVGGGITFLLNLVPQLCRLTPGEKIILLVPNGLAWVENLSALPNLEIRKIRLGRPEPISRVWFEQVTIPKIVRNERIDLLCSIADITSLSANCRKALWIRNLLIHTRRDFGWPKVKMIRIYFLRIISALSMKKADRVIFVSDACRQEIMSFNNLNPAKTRIIYHGVNEKFLKIGTQRVQVIRKPVILSVSSIYRYKNFLPLIEAFHVWSSNQEEEWQLRIIGQNLDAEYFRKMEKARDAGSARKNIQFDNEIPYNEIQQAYRDASIFAFPSILESFGHPLVEALASGISVVAADTPINREILGDFGYYFQGENVSALIKALDKALAAPKLAHEDFFEKRGFTWESCARKTWKCIQEII